MSVIVYQMGKVGSQAVQQALKDKGINPEHVHYYKTVDGEFYQSKYAKAYTQLVNTKGHRIISLVRDPIRRDISAFVWQLSKENYFKYPSFDPDILTNLFIHKYNHDWCLDWFDLEPKRALGLDVYEHDFNAEAGVGLIHSPEWITDFLILRTDKLNTEPVKLAFEKVFGIPELYIPHKNQTGLWYYQGFIEHLRGKLPTSLLDKVYGSKFAKHFFTELEIAKAYTYWSNAGMMGIGIPG